MNNGLIITGASHGIGLATATLFQQEGWDIINLSRTPCPLDAVKNIRVDLSDITWPSKFPTDFSDSLKSYECITLIHNAAILTKDTVLSLTGDMLQHVLQLNVIAPQQLNQLIIPQMPSGSAILYVGSTLATRGVPETASYVTSKHALLGLMRATMFDVAHLGIHTACICPGCTDTDMLRTHAKNDPNTLQALAEFSCFKRLVKPEEIAAPLLFAANNPSLNGSILHANLGQK